ncbi:uncharacterized protein B0H64DRAFT_446045 [Chaetomium fimeti]|uniref:Uncharacterized protein n=1 Tax=Chaetomium fimeti TaxID=1854472 RepID=A0AAE0LME4_9PEZI|nr:hypothetical protein B0H64DRAFT_446887 [Chaetomium fimeti]KAK3292046.1 hypothetical protein B0H64DRAFT_446045 [Chaetomium fimeti]
MKKYADAVGLADAYARYQSTLQEIFRNIQDGVLATASDSLLGVSKWLLSYVKKLGLTSDDQASSFNSGKP